MGYKELIERLRSLGNGFLNCDAPKYVSYCNDAAAAIETLLAEREIRKHGKWEFVREGKYIKRIRAYCSSCGKRSGISGTIANQKKPFCPHCGAIMDIKDVLC